MTLPPPSPNRWKNWWVRTFWTFVMIGGFVGIILAGHIWVVLLVVVIQILVYWEVIAIAHVPSKAKKMPWFRTLQVWFLLSTNYFLYGQTIIQYFKQSVFVDAFLTPLATHHQFISFSLYVVGFVAFVSNLQKGHYKFQFSQFAWTHMTLILVICQSQFIVKNIFEGLVWFLLPTSLVICNDITAYIFGFFFGRTPLIKLSPKKTWEGFLGALVSTIIFGFFFAGFINQYPYLTCPVRTMRTNSMSGVTCNLNPVFVPIEIQLFPAMRALVWHITRLEVASITVTPFQLHAIIMALFASIIAPFGGFFASGAKRAFKLKDFGDYIPGHGGITDRMDCQFLMSFFAFLYYQSFIARAELSVGQVLQTVVAGLAPKDQLELFYDLRDYLTQQGLLDLNEMISRPARRPLFDFPQG
ncbi:phosphatidate cytidylyltransferase [Zopfochytrium polystomum]|nr:phosphatidate cytidylyltransferase [Zopfochytrium polystomum]